MLYLQSSQGHTHLSPAIGNIKDHKQTWRWRFSVLKRMWVCCTSILPPITHSILPPRAHPISPQGAHSTLPSTTHSLTLPRKDVTKVVIAVAVSSALQESLCMYWNCEHEEREAEPLVGLMSNGEWTQTKVKTCTRNNTCWQHEMIIEEKIALNRATGFNHERGV